MNDAGAPLISVAIASYNYARYITKAIDSVLGQTYPNVEVVVTDNGSTDGTAELIAERYGNEPRVRFSVNESNLGIVGNFNRAFSLTRGAFVLFLSADDWYLPEHLARLHAVLASHTQIDAVFSGIYFADREERLFSMRVQANMLPFDYVDIRDELPEMLSDVPPLCLPATLFRRSVLEALGALDPEIGIASDWELAVRLAAAGKRFAYLHEPSTVVRRHDTNASGLIFNRSGQIVAELIAIFEKFLDHPAMVRLRGREAAALQHLTDMYEANRELYGGEVLTPELHVRFEAVRRRLEAAAARYEPARVRESTIGIVLAAVGPPGPTLRAIASVAAQSAGNWQLVVVEQGGLPLRQYLRGQPAHERITCVRPAGRLTTGAALNLGAQLARGEYLAFLSPDETLAPSHLDELCGLLAQTGSEVVASGTRLVVEEANADATIFQPLRIVEGLFRGAADPPALAAVANALPLGAILHHRRCFSAAGGFHEGALLLEDFDYLSRLQSVARISFGASATLDVHVRLGLGAHRLAAFGPAQYLAALEALYAARLVEPALEPLRAAQRAAVAGLIERFGTLAGDPDGLIEVFGVLAGRRAVVSSVG